MPVRSSEPMPRILSPNSTLASTVFHGKSEWCWNTIPRSAAGRSTGSPSTVSEPVVGRMKPAMALRSVDLPQPEGPSRHTNSPPATSNEIWRTASTRSPLRPKVMPTSSSTM